MTTLLSAREVAALLGLPESRIRYWAQTGFIGASQRSGGRAAYDFADLIALKSAQALLAGGMSLQAARRLLSTLKEQLPGRALGELRVVADGETVVCSGAGAPFEPLSGQLLLDFSTAELHARVVALESHTPAEPDEPAFAPATAYDHFAHALTIGGSEAEEANRAALTIDPCFAAAHNNCGLALHAREDLAGARRAFEAALAVDPEQPEARYNLGCVCEALGLRAAAQAHWARVVGRWPGFADAHFNLGHSLVEAGEVELGQLHLAYYRRLTEHVEAARAAG